MYPASQNYILVAELWCFILIMAPALVEIIVPPCRFSQGLMHSADSTDTNFWSKLESCFETCIPSHDCCIISQSWGLQKQSPVTAQKQLVFQARLFRVSRWGLGLRASWYSKRTICKSSKDSARVSGTFHTSSFAARPRPTSKASYEKSFSQIMWNRNSYLSLQYLGQLISTNTQHTIVVLHYLCMYFCGHWIPRYRPMETAFNSAVSASQENVFDFEIRSGVSGYADTSELHVLLLSN